MNSQTVVVRKTFQMSREAVFDAWLDAEGMRSWMCPGPVVSCEATIEPHVGGRFLIVMKAPDAEIINTGVYRIIDRPTKLQFTWISSRWDNQETLISIELQELDTGCELVLTHERFPFGHSPEQLIGGWTQILDKLGRHLAL